MRNYYYRVVFRNGPSIHVYAGNESQAIILAQAERIKGGLEYLNVDCAYTID